MITGGSFSEGKAAGSESIHPFPIRLHGVVLSHAQGQLLRLEIFMAVTTNNAVFWDMTSCDYC
jgi:hypothetical protein